MARTKKKDTQAGLVCIRDEKSQRRIWSYNGTILHANMLRQLGPERVEAALLSIEDENLRNAIALEFRTEWAFWARPEQLLPEGEWRNIIILAGRGFGKTRYGAEAVIEWKKQGFKYVNIIGPTYDDAWGVMVEGESGILAVCPPWMRPTINLKKGLIWPDGSVSRVFTAEEPERLRGKQHQKVWADELCAWRYPEAWDQMKFGLRLKAPRGAPVICNQALVTTTPKPSKLLRDLLKDPQSFVVRGSTKANVANLSPDFYRDLQKKYAGTRLGRQELDAEVLDDNPGALWQLANIDQGRRYTIDQETGKVMLPPMRRIVVAIDPAVTSNENSDETGIIVAGLGTDGHGYILEDGTSKERLSPDKWAARAVRRFHKWQADRVVAEVNNGGDLVEVVIRAYGDTSVSYKAVRASRGKITRAEPVAALYEQGRVHHCGHFPELENQMCEYNPTTDKKSPDRMDALVWAITELMLGENDTGVLDWMEEEAQRLAETSGVDISHLIETTDKRDHQIAERLIKEATMKKEEKTTKKTRAKKEAAPPAPVVVAQTLTREERRRLAATSFNNQQPAPAPVSNGQQPVRGINSTKSMPSDLDLLDKFFGNEGDRQTDLDEDDD